MSATSVLRLAVLSLALGPANIMAQQEPPADPPPGWEPTALSITSYAVAFYFLALTLEFMPVGIVYAVWSGLGIVLIALMGYVLFSQRLDLPAVLGIALIVAGILVISLLSDTAHH